MQYLIKTGNIAGFQQQNIEVTHHDINKLISRKKNYWIRNPLSQPVIILKFNLLQLFLVQKGGNNNTPNYTLLLKSKNTKKGSRGSLSELCIGFYYSTTFRE